MPTNPRGRKAKAAGRKGAKGQSVLSERTSKSTQKGAVEQQPRSLAIATRGIGTGTDFVSVFSAIVADVLDGSVTPQVANSACNAGRVLIKMVELQFKNENRLAAAMKSKTLQLS